MADVVVLGAGVAGHTAALHLSRLLPKGNTVTVVSPNSQWNWIPSNIWVGVGKMGKKDVVFPLAPVYAKKGIRFVQAKATAIWPEGDADDARPGVDVEHTGPGRAGQTERIRYDYLVNATGPQLKFQMTKASARTAATRSPSARPTTQSRRRPSSPRRSAYSAVAVRRRSSSAWATAPAPVRVPPSNMSSTSTTSCARRAYATGRAWSISPTSENSATSVSAG